jgi:LacI family transcriptional regulator
MTDGPLKERITIYEVAAKAGVSLATVSRVINNHQNVTEKTRKKVQKAIEELGYRPSGLAKALATSKTTNIGVIIPSANYVFVANMLNGITKTAREYGYAITLFVTSHEKDEALQAIDKLITSHVDGAIIFDTKITDEEIISFAKNKPVIVLDRNLDHPNVYSSVVKNKQMVYELIKEMIKRGYKKFSYASGPKRTKDNQDRYEGFLKALDEQNIVPHLQFVGNFTIESGYSIGESIAKIEDKPDFIFCANDEMAVGLIRALKDNKIHIPQQIAVAGFDGIYLGDYITPKLTTIKVDYLNWGVYISQKNDFIN